MIGWKWYLAGIKRKYERRKTHLFAMKRPIWRSRIPTITVVGDLAVIVDWAESRKTSTFPVLCFTEINLSIAIYRSCRLIKSMIRFCSFFRSKTGLRLILEVPKKNFFFNYSQRQFTKTKMKEVVINFSEDIHMNKCKTLTRFIFAI